MHYSAGAIVLGTSIALPGLSWFHVPITGVPGALATVALGLTIVGVGFSGALHDWGHDDDNPRLSVFDVVSGKWYLDEMCDPFSPNPLRRCVVEF